MPVILKFVRLQSVQNVEVKILQNNLPAATRHHQTFQTSRWVLLAWNPINNIHCLKFENLPTTIKLFQTKKLDFV